MGLVFFQCLLCISYDTRVFSTCFGRHWNHKLKPSCGGFLKQSYRQSSSSYIQLLDWDVQIFHRKNPPAMGVSPGLWKPPCLLARFEASSSTRSRIRNLFKWPSRLPLANWIWFSMGSKAKSQKAKFLPTYFMGCGIDPQEAAVLQHVPSSLELPEARVFSHGLIWFIDFGCPFWGTFWDALKSLKLHETSKSKR